MLILYMHTSFHIVVKVINDLQQLYSINISTNYIFTIMSFSLENLVKFNVQGILSINLK
jgi:hypothetical protein